ncbi:MAG: chromosome segregation SMC family protein [Actinomycetota bacterium]
MFVKSLRLAGFKSFADATVLDFEQGVNVIVGPNGSGKSNIADALQWVLGSQAPSTLRSGSMEDVIFAGSPERPRLGIAEVELTLDNTSRVLPLDLSEVTISRSTDRSGASEYRINGAACRLLDVTELLSDTGIGRSIHTVVGQGQLDAVLHARPEDRRTFIEEAAQIGKYKRRKQRALTKMERVDDNLTRLHDVLSELRRSIKPLKRQASAAAAYSELRSEQIDLKQVLAAAELTRLRAAADASDPEADAHRAALLDDELANVRAVLGNATSEREAIAENAEATQQTAHRITRAAERLGGLKRLASERAKRIEARLQAETEEGYRERIRLLTGEIERWTKQATSLEARAEEEERATQIARERSEAAAADVQTAERSLVEARELEVTHAQALVRAEGAEVAGRSAIAAAETRVTAAQERRDLVAAERERAREALTAAEADLQTIDHQLDTATEASAAAETRLEASRELVRGLRDERAATGAGKAAAIARVDALEEVLSLINDLPGAFERVAPLITQARLSATDAGESDEQTARRMTEAEAVVEQRWQEVAASDEELRRLDALASGGAERVATCRRRVEARDVELAAIDDELSRARDAVVDAERSAIETRAELPAMRARSEDATRARTEREGIVSSARAKAAEAAADASTTEVRWRTAHERVLSARLRIEEAEGGIADAEKALEGIEDLRGALARMLERAATIAEIAGFAGERASGWSVTAHAAAQQAAERARESERRLVSLRARERELQEALDEVAKRKTQAEIRRAEVGARLDALAERAMEEWALTLDALAEVTIPDDAEDIALRERIEKLDREIKRLGAVNPHAKEEFEKLAERESFLETQIADLKSSKRDLMVVVKEVDETIVEVFSSAFADVATEFEKTFTRLFPGGEGKLKLIDPDDVLSSGIEVEAKPAGKNVRKLSLLSGGERSLVALAFLFAIFRSRPSPFYLLDEVEAALDDVNLSRFLGLVAELERRAQVLVVTHQKRTMEAADILYGVSIGKDGVSRVVAKRMETTTV